MKKLFIILSFIILNSSGLSQHNFYYLDQLFYKEEKEMGWKVEAGLINKDDEYLDIIMGYFNSTKVYYAGIGKFDWIPDLQFRGRVLAFCDYNGDGYKDLITMELTTYDSS